MANFERVEWIVQPDSATAAAALQKGEVDWVEQPLIDLCPMLRKSPDVLVAVNDPYGWQPIIALNHLSAPFDNPKLRRALLPALDQKAFIAAVIGEQAELGHVPGGYFADGQPMASHIGLEVLTRPRDIGLARRLVSESGYRGETLVLLSSSDRPVYSAVAYVARDLFQAMGLNVDFQAMDWGSVVTRRTNQNPTDKGGWSAFITALDGVTVSNPGGNFALRGNGKKAWFGWPTDEELESLRGAWFDAPDLRSQKAIAEQIQLRGLETLPYIPLGQFFQARSLNLFGDRAAANKCPQRSIQLLNPSPVNMLCSWRDQGGSVGYCHVTTEPHRLENRRSGRRGRGPRVAAPDVDRWTTTTRVFCNRPRPTPLHRCPMSRSPM